MVRIAAALLVCLVFFALGWCPSTLPMASAMELEAIFGMKQERSERDRQGWYAIGRADEDHYWVIWAKSGINADCRASEERNERWGPGWTECAHQKPASPFWAANQACVRRTSPASPSEITRGEPRHSEGLIAIRRGVIELVVLYLRSDPHRPDEGAECLARAEEAAHLLHSRMWIGSIVYWSIGLLCGATILSLRKRRTSLA